MQPLNWQDQAALARQIRELPPLDNTAVEAEQGDLLIDAWVPGAPLLISFAYVGWDKPSDFYLYGRSKKLEGMTGRPINRIMLRDRNNHWYLRGVTGVADSAEQLAERLRALIAAVTPSEVWCIGESMGGYAAILYGILLDADRIVSFGALSSFSPQFAERYHDMRWHRSMAELPPSSSTLTTDLPELARAHGYAKPLHLVLGTSAGVNAPNAVNLDVMHGQRFADLPGVRYHYYPEAEHAVTHWLSENQQFDAILMHCLFDAADPTLLPRPALPLPAPAAAMVQWPSQFPRLDAARAATAPADCAVLVHTVTPGAPLLICFADGTDFEFVEERASLEQIYGCRLNQIVLRDVSGQAWQRGLEGLGNDAEGVAANLRTLVARMGSTNVICIGHGRGGFAALLIGCLLNASRILALNPLSLLDAGLAECWRDRRYSEHLAALEASPTAPGPRDLLPILARYRGKVHIACTAKGEGTGDDVGSHDVMHALRLASVANVQVQPWPASGDLLAWMRGQNVLLGFIGYCAELAKLARAVDTSSSTM